MSREVEAQVKFAYMVGDLLCWCRVRGYTVTLGEAFRDPARAVKGSFHPRRLAIDLNLFVGGIYMRESEAYKVLGDYWKSLGGTWGGDFTRADGNHFSLGE